MKDQRDERLCGVENMTHICDAMMHPHGCQSIFVVENKVAVVTHLQVIPSWVMLYEAMTIIIRSFIPMHPDFLLRLFISELMISYVPGFRTFLLHIIICESRSSRGIGFDRH